MEGEKEDNENKYNNSDLLTTDSCNKADKENGDTTVGETCKSEPESFNTTFSCQRYANPDKIENTAEGFDVGINKEHGNINLESETDKNSLKEEQGDSFDCIDHKDCQTTENENQAENPKIQSTNRTRLGNAGGQTSDSLHPANSYQRVFVCEQGPFNSRHMASVKRQLEDGRKRADSNIPEAFGRCKISKGKGDVTVSKLPPIGPEIIEQQEQEKKNTKPRHGGNSSITSSTYSSENSKTSGKHKFGDALFDDTTISKVDGTDQNVPGLPDANQTHHSSENSDEGHQKDDSKSTVNSVFATTEIKNYLDDSKDNSLEADINSKEAFGSEHGPVRVNEIEQIVNSSLVINFAGTNKQRENIAHANPEKINTEEQATAPEASVELTPKEITNQNAPMQEYKEEQASVGDSLTENKKRVADKEEVDVYNKTSSNMDMRNKYKSKKNGNGSQSDTSSEDQNFRKDSSSEFKGKINLQIPHVKNPVDNTVNSGESYQYGRISRNIIHSPNNNNLEYDRTGSGHLNDKNKSTQTEENLKEESMKISDYFECQKCSENNLTISNLETHIVDLNKEISKKDMDIKQLKQENLEKDNIIKELQKKTSEMEETSKNFKESNEECKSAIESLLKDLSIKKSSERVGLWNFLTGNKSKANKDGTINAINQIKSHIQKLEAKLTGRQKEIKEKDILINIYVEERYRNIEYKNLEKTFEKKGKDQVKMIEGRDTEIKALIKERMKEKYFTEKFTKLSVENDELKNQLKECKVNFNDALKDLREKDKKVADFNSVFNAQIATITKLQNEKKKLEHESTTLCKQQVKFIEGRDTEIKALIEERNMEEKYFTEKFIKLSEENDDLKNQLKECKVDFNNVLIDLKAKDKKAAEFYSVLNTQIVTIIKLQNEKKKLEHESTTLCKDQVKFLEGRDTEIKELVKERNMKEKYYTEKFIKLSEENNDLKKQLKECKVNFNDALKDLKKKDKTVAEFNSVFIIQIATITKLQNETHEGISKISTLEKNLQKTKMALEKFKNQCITLESQLNQERKKTKTFEETLGNLRNSVKKEESDLQYQNEALQINLNRICNTIQNVCEPVSHKENARQTEETFINNALERIRKIQQDVNNYEDQIRIFEGNCQSKAYLHIREMLLSTSEELQRVESERKKKIFTSRMEAISRVKNLLEKLEQKAQQ